MAISLVAQRKPMGTLVPMNSGDESALLDAEVSLIDALADEYERAFKAGQSPRIEDFLLPLDENLRPAALRELLRVEVELRRGRSDAICVDDYLARFRDSEALVREVCQNRDAVGAHTERRTGNDAAKTAAGADPFATRVTATSANVSAETKAYNRDSAAASGSGTLEVRCPNCHAPTVVTVDTALTDLTCSACGTHFSLVDHSKGTRTAPPLARMGRFELIDRLGVGSFGSVWKARDKELDRTVAIKIPRQGSMSAEEQEKFFREARAAAQLRHPNIVCVHEVGRDGESIYIVSDFVRGVTLDDWLQGQKLTGREAAELCAKVADALHHAHEHGVVHRDLKPANIVIDPNGEPHLMDFGLARREVGEVTVTVAGQILGTPAYMSPEQAKGEAHTADCRSDIYSVGVILFQLLTGELPFRGNVRMLIHQVIHDEPRNPRSFNDRVPRDLDTICIKCLQKDPDKRYQQATELSADLRRFLARQPIQARPIGRVERFWRGCRRNPVVASLSAIAVTLLVLLAAVASVGYVKTSSALRQADESHDDALRAVEKSLTVVGSDRLTNVPQFETERRELLQEALEVYKRLLQRKPTDERTRFTVAKAYYHVGEIHRLLGAHAKAREAYQHAIEWFNTLSAEFPKEPEYLHYLGMAHDYLGELLRAKDVMSAEQNYRAALEIQNALVEQTHGKGTVSGQRNDVSYWQELSRTHNNYGILLLESDRYSDAKESLQEALRILGELQKSDERNINYQQELARASINLGNVHLKLHSPLEAKAAYERAVKLLNPLVKRYPYVHDYSFKLGVSLVNLYSLPRESVRSNNFESNLKRAIVLLKHIADDYPSYPLYRKELANAHYSLGDLYDKASKVAEARENWDAGYAICNALAQENDGNPEYHSLLGRLLGGRAWLAEKDMDINRAIALVKQAIEHQQQAVKLNSRNTDYDFFLMKHKEYLDHLNALP